jgi:CRISPR-associated protein Cpf1
MKDGYISQVVHEIVKLAIENNALIVLENLNT